jgi:hypothetical protein
VADRPTRCEKFEVTPEMIEAGVSVLYDSGAIENPLHEADRDLARRVFLEMLWHLSSATSAS